MGTRVQTIVLYRGRNAHGESRKHDEQTHLTGRSIGLSIVGGIDSPRGPMGIFVKTLYANGLAAQSGLIHKGDEIVSVNGIELFGKTHAEALHVFKMFSKVDVTLVIRRATLTYYHVNLKATDKSRIEEIYGNQGEVAVSDAAPLADDSIAKTTLRVERHDMCNIDGYFLDYVTVTFPRIYFLSF
ncbi:unnamed protein product [Toxocara canis]|uniref:PDZ domain-containing protein n=1 Tax=Toxocara canis TaxID=6265 RepID=A0A183TUV1_TOXCA|nr:unnamed protein product [Toxocara canis]